MIAINFREQTLINVQEKLNSYFNSGCKLFTWTCNDQPVKNFQSLEFDNDYTAFVSIKVKQHAEDEWHLLLRRYQLMESAHGEIGSNIHVVLTEKNFTFMPRNIYQLRFLLQQPSPIWKDFSIVHVKMSQSAVAAKDRKLSIERLLANTLVNDDQMTEMTNARIPSINELSQHLQGLWSICAAMQQADYGPDHVKRFDVDGSYDLQILSYT